MRGVIWSIVIALIIVIFAAIAVVALTNDEVADDLRDAADDLESAGENLGDAAETTGDEIQDAAEETGLNDAAEEVGEEVGEEAGNIAEEGADELEEQTDQLEEETDQLTKEDTVMEVISSQSNLTTFAQAVNNANLAGTLDDENVTVFAPTNAAFQAVPNLNALLQNRTALQTLINGHVVEDDIISAEMDSQTLTTRSGRNITLSATESGIYLNGSILITVTDLEADNGVVHIIDAVIQ